MARVSDKIPVPLRAAAWRAINRMPARAQRLFSKSDEHRRWRMQQLYSSVAPPPPAAPLVLFWVPGGMRLMLHVETAIAASLRLRGYNVHAIICDAPYRACVRREVTDAEPISDWGKLCETCVGSNRSMLEMMGIPCSFIGDYVPEEKRAEFRSRAASLDPESVRQLRHAGVAIGPNVISTVARYLQGMRSGNSAELMREYAYTALMTAEASSRAYETLRPERIFMSHGTYVDWGPPLHVALARGIPVTGWKASYLTSRFFFRHVEDPDRIDFHKLSDHAWKERIETGLTAVEEASLQTFLHRRYHQRVSFDMKHLQEYTGDVGRFRSQYGLRPDLPVWGVFAHVNWDSVSDYSPMAYPSFDDWMVDTIEQVSRITDVQWLIKVHPVEAHNNTAEGVQRLVQTRFPNLPAHVHLVPAEEKISPLEFFQVVDGGVTVYGTAGLELAVQGKPVILSGEAHYGMKGFTHDGLSIESYRALLKRAGSIGPLSEEQTRLARMYAYSYFVQRQIPFPPVRSKTSIWWELQHEQREQLLPGRNRFVDFICERLMQGQDFVMERELVELADSDEWA